MIIINGLDWEKDVVDDYLFLSILPLKPYEFHHNHP
jgi:hypothetical protein